MSSSTPLRCSTCGLAHSPDLKSDREWHRQQCAKRPVLRGRVVETLLNGKIAYVLYVDCSWCDREHVHGYDSEDGSKPTHRLLLSRTVQTRQLLRRAVS